MQTYEVNVEIDNAIHDDYLRWLRAHVEEILALPGFIDADVCEITEPAADGVHRLSMRFQLVDADALVTYIRDHASRLRADGVARFGERMRATRRIMHPLLFAD